MRLSRIFLGTLVVAILASAAEAQHLGDVSPQYHAVNLATNLACTGRTKTFTTGTTAGFNNIGQNPALPQRREQHRRPEVSPPRSTGIDNQGNLYRISDVMQLTGLFPRGKERSRESERSADTDLHHLRTGYRHVSARLMPETSDRTHRSHGAYQLAQIDHVNFNLSPAGSSQSDNLVQTPFGNPRGRIFQYNTTSAAGATLAISCSLSAISTSQVVFTATLANNTNVQPFAVPASVCPLMNVQFNTGGGARASPEK